LADLLRDINSVDRLTDENANENHANEARQRWYDMTVLRSIVLLRIGSNRFRWYNYLTYCLNINELGYTGSKQRGEEELDADKENQ